MTADYTARESLIGYLYQVRYALLRLIKGDEESEIVIEGLDDIVFQTNGTPIELLQTKHHMKKKGNLTDNSSDLWKSIRNWCSNINQGSVKADNTQFIIITTERAKMGCIASLLRPQVEGTDTKRDCKKALEMLTNVAETSKSKSNDDAYNIFLKLSERDKESLVKNIVVLDSSPGIEDSKWEIIRSVGNTLERNHREHFFEMLEGWWLNRVIGHVSRGSPGVIRYGELNAHLINLRDQFRFDELTADYPTPIPASKLHYDNSVFVNQLLLVNASRNIIEKAMSDYYRAFNQRTKWIADDLADIQELDRYDARLVDEWERQYEGMKVKLGKKPTGPRKITEGYELFCLITLTMNKTIRNNFTHEYLMRGSYHMLADVPRIGWHADYLNLLSKVGGRS